jgi:hypothetical protein
MPNVARAVVTLSLAFAAGCSGIPSADERKAFLAEEQFRTGYNIAVTSVLKKPIVESVIGGAAPLSGIGMLFRLGALAAEPGARERIGGLSPLERIDVAMKALLESRLPVTAAFLDRASFGGSDFVPPVSNIAFDALQQAKMQRFHAMFFVHLQPALVSATGFGNRQLILTGTTVFRSIKSDRLLHFENYRLDCNEGNSIPEVNIPAVISSCTDDLIGKMKAGLDAALMGRSAPGSHPEK